MMITLLLFVAFDAVVAAGLVIVFVNVPVDDAEAPAVVHDAQYLSNNL